MEASRAVRGEVLGGDGARLVVEVPVEVPVNIVYATLPFAVMMASPGDFEDFAVGFSVTEGIVADAAEVRGVAVSVVPRGVVVDVDLAPAALRRHMARLREAGGRSMAGRTGCGVCGIESLEHLPAARPVMAAGGGGWLGGNTNGADGTGGAAGVACGDAGGSCGGVVCGGRGDPVGARGCWAAQCAGQADWWVFAGGAGGGGWVCGADQPVFVRDGGEGGGFRGGDGGGDIGADFAGDRAGGGAGGSAGGGGAAGRGDRVYFGRVYGGGRGMNAEEGARLVQMSGQIAAFFRHLPEEAAAAAIAGHINQFWPKPMRRRLIELDANTSHLDPLVAAALPLVRAPSG